MYRFHFCRLREEEIGELTGTDEFGEFYRKLKVLKDQHRSHGGDDVSVCASTTLLAHRQCMCNVVFCMVCVGALCEGTLQCWFILAD